MTSQLGGTVTELVLKMDASGRVDAFITIRIYKPLKYEIEALTGFVGVPSGVVIRGNVTRD